MRTILYIIRKEFKQIARDKFMGRAIIAMPILQMLVLVYAATFEIKNVELLVVGFAVVAQQIPLAVTDPLPSAVIFPPETADV